MHSNSISRNRPAELHSHFTSNRSVHPVAQFAGIVGYVEACSQISTIKRLSAALTQATGRKGGLSGRVMNLLLAGRRVFVPRATRARIR